jgi:outer membrane protein TolC
MKILLLILFLPLSLKDQERVLNLEEIVQRAREQSVASLLAETGKETSYWEYRSYRSSLFPQLSLRGMLPDYNRSFTPITQPDGTVIFQPVMNNSSGLSLELSQNIGLTGGELFISSGLQRFDDFERDFMQYNTNPVSIGFRQSLFAYNPFRWACQIEPLRLERSRRKYLTDLEAVSLQATSLYFNLLLAQIDHEMARQNVENGQKTLEIARVRHEKGRISDNDLLQVRYILLNAQNAQAQARQEMQNALLQLKTYTGLEGGSFNVVEPGKIPALQVSEPLALEEARKNKETVLEFQIRALQAQGEVQAARARRGHNVEMFASVGLSNRADGLEGVYQSPANQQMLQIGFTVPLLDWGRGRAIIKTAEANRKLEDYSIKLDQLAFEQQIITQVGLIQSLSMQVLVAQEAADVARQRYAIAGESFALGRISITDLNIAQNEKDTARRIYLQALRNYWETYYRLRMLTLYDFERGEKIREEK